MPLLDYTIPGLADIVDSFPDARIELSHTFTSRSLTALAKITASELVGRHAADIANLKPISAASANIEGYYSYTVSEKPIGIVAIYASLAHAAMAKRKCSVFFRGLTEKNPSNNPLSGLVQAFPPEFPRSIRNATLGELVQASHELFTEARTHLDRPKEVTINVWILPRRTVKQSHVPQQ